MPSTRSGTTSRSATAPTTSATPTATRATRTVAANKPPAATSKKTTTRKPLTTKENTLDSIASTTRTASPTKLPTSKPKATTSKKGTLDDYDREPIKAFLRIRPQGSDVRSGATPYLKALSDMTVQMTDPGYLTGGNRFRLASSSSPSSNYTFTEVFPPQTQQEEFFQRTALPLVKHLLNGESSLLFAYGVTNSGKTYTIQGGQRQDEAGLLPRCLDVVFNSIDGLYSTGPYRPTRLASVEFDPDALRSSKRHQTLFSSLSSDTSLDSLELDSTVFTVDKNFEYAVWVSYMEVYNEKIFDLLNVSGGTGQASDIGSYFQLASKSAVTSSTSTATPGMTVTRKALTLKNDPEGGKYVAGLQEVQVRSAAEAKAVMKFGQINRRVFGTLANSSSSRSHGIFTIKVIRIHRGSSQDSEIDEEANCARLAIVDLAGSERVRNAGTRTEGDRIREAGNINKSLMVLGQCMDAMRANQKRLMAAGAVGAQAPRLAIVPFRHSKITELFQDFFIGEGRAVMIVNVNPFDTGFDENANVMKFAAIAREVTTVPIPAGGPRLKKIPSSTLAKPTQTSRRVMLSIGGKGGKASEAATILEVMEEDEDVDMEDIEEDADYGAFKLVEELFERIEELELKLYDAEMRCALVEAETREEVAQEMEERMEKMERMYSARITREIEATESKADKKIDLLQRAGLLTLSHSDQSIPQEDSFIEEDSIQDESPRPFKRQRSVPSSPSKYLAKKHHGRTSSVSSSTDLSGMIVEDDEPVPRQVLKPDLKRNPIMDNDAETEGTMTDDRETISGDEEDVSQTELSGVVSDEEASEVEDAEEAEESAVEGLVLDDDEEEEDGSALEESFASSLADSPPESPVLRPGKTTIVKTPLYRKAIISDDEEEEGNRSPHKRKHESQASTLSNININSIELNTSTISPPKRPQEHLHVDSDDEDPIDSLSPSKQKATSKGKSKAVKPSSKTTRVVEDLTAKMEKTSLNDSKTGVRRSLRAKK